MLHIYYGREDCDKARFIFGNTGEKAIVLVPEQFTLEAEREALKCLDADGIMDLEILSISRLGFRMLSEVGGTKKSRIDIYGRHIILMSVIDKLAEDGELTAYGRLAGKNSFAELVNNFISGMKQHGVTPEVLSEARDEMAEHEILTRKLDDMVKIFTEYEKRIAGRFADTEDYLSLYVKAAAESESIKGKEIWVWGFDSFAPKSEELIFELMKVADVKLVVTACYVGRDKELFALTGNMIRRFEQKAAELGIACERKEIPQGFGHNGGVTCIADDDIGIYASENGNIKCSQILERELFAIPVHPLRIQEAADGNTLIYEGTEIGDGGSMRDMTLVAAANYYSEAETAAAYVKELVRERGLKYRDILIACNDLAGRAEIIKRVFAEYDMEVFTDEKRGILSEPLVIYVLSLIAVMAKGYRTQDIMSMLKTGLTPVSKEAADELENYVLKYRIRTSAWKKPFKYGSSEYSEEVFGKIEETRRFIVSFIAPFESSFKESRHAENRVRALYDFLSGDKQLRSKISAEDMGEIWDAVMLILDQLVNVIGDESVSMDTFYELLEAGLAAVTVGHIPPAADGLVLGTLQRTRTGSVKALVVIGANDGVLPKESPDEELLSEDEKEILTDAGFAICALDKVRVQEERLAVYRAFSKPEKYIYVSYAGSNNNGDEEKPSRIFNTIRKIFPNVPVLTDIDGRSDIVALTASRKSALGHLVSSVRENISSGGTSDVLAAWSDIILWYEENYPDELKKATEGFFYSNREEPLKREATDRLYGKNTDEAVILSPSRLEKYSRCPFAHFVKYGLRPEERRIFEAGSREIGDIYHECLMNFSQKMTEKSDDGTMLWYSVSREACDALIKEIIENEAAKYKEGLMTSGNEEAYRKDRMCATLCEAAWALVCQARAGDIKQMFFEEGFGHSEEKVFSAIEVDTASGKAYIEGKIDRVDILGNGAVKVIDYKSGKEKWNTDEARGGWRLQLMLYLKAASRQKSTGKHDELQGFAAEGETVREPAGIFYFLIKDADLKEDGKSKCEIASDIADSIRKEFRMNGLAVDSFNNIENIEANMNQYSDVVVNLKKVKAKPEKSIAQSEASSRAENEYQYTGAVMSREEFGELQTAFDRKIDELVNKLLAGDIAARPKRTGDSSACTYCGYRSICRFDTGLPGCVYEKI